ncbi:hypothetical protein HL033_00275 [Neoehrlichia mikurensis]|uniref:Uncharacterized protein n=1 Tax=Neoehrlichia mikurensis TaxID=89586 RepID=A0A9Q9BZE5_9RICK|nr:hypothetical protein [Neoehrlichia mikurensis]QXK92014.1 hypothetical protein IAH97_00275 [Neoehrlichia mikurensis]QXK92472.1 hypothetical protein HUN61_00275 [Neoehrlichia mikurensis]QXK93707.1 hypothetical protein HL033_00275 [Neoehrlichia mikurensis]UTO55320.1 hypothetical protein LUA82_04010 [Neoehrlichia mikurensis]UTO56240.1 hypothetical protein LUA81_03975 [Neoehrlichia mikurensis]
MINKQGAICISNLLAFIVGSEIIIESRTTQDRKRAMLVCIFSVSILTLILLRIYCMFFHRKINVFLKNHKESFILDAPLLKIEIYNKEHSCNACSMLQVTLDKKVISGYTTDNADRQILIQDYINNPVNSINAQIKIYFISKPGSIKERIMPFTSLHAKPNIIINIKEKKFIRYNILHLKSIILSIDELKKLLDFCVDEKSIHIWLLEKYLSENCNNYYLNNRLLYILKNFPCSSKIRNLLSDKLRDNLCDALRYLQEHDFNKLTNNDLKILIKDIMDLIIKRSCEYTNLHEILHKEEYIKKLDLQIGDEDIIACYFDTLNNKTSCLIKKSLLYNNTQSKLMIALHSYIEKCKKYNENKFKDLRTLYVTNEVKIGYDILSNFITKHNLNDNINQIIYAARNEVSKKYSKLLNSYIIGLVKEEVTSISRLQLSKGSI